MFGLSFPVLIGVALLLLIVGVAVIALFIASLYRTVVPTNMVHIVNSAKGRITYGSNTKDGNTYYAFPSWMPVIGVNVTYFETSNFPVQLHKSRVHALNNVPIRINVQSFFALSNADIVSQRVASDGKLKEDLEAIVTSALRTVCAQFTIEDLLAKRLEIAEMYTKEVSHSIEKWGLVVVGEIAITHIEDDEGSNAISDIRDKEISAINRESRLVQADNHREAQMKEIEAQRQVDLSKQEAEQQVSTRTAEKEKAVGIAKELTRQEIAEQALNTAERDMAVKKANETRQAEIAKSVSITQAEAKQAIEVLQAQTDKDKQALEAEAQLVLAQRQAEGITAVEQAKANGVRANGEALAESEKAMQLASVTAQITLAEKVSGDKDYQDYLIRVEQVKANTEVGIAQAAALEKANINIVGGPGANVGLSMASVLSGFTSTELGQQVVGKVLGSAMTASADKE